MYRRSFLKTLGGGLLAGILASFVMTAVMLLLRYALGVPLPVELGGDRFIPFIRIFDFLKLLRAFGGVIGAKRFALISSFEAQVIFGTLFGAVYAAVEERSKKGGVLFTAVVLGAIWLFTLALFSGPWWPWSVLSANFRGSPPGWASVATAAGLLLSYAVYGLTLVPAYRFMTRERGGSSRNAAGPTGRHIGRRAFIVGAAGVILGLGSDLLSRTLVKSSALPYDGTQYLGTGIQHITPNDQFYIVTKNIIDPYPDKSVWRLEIGGKVGAPRTYDFGALSRLPSVEQEMTLECISNGVGGGLISNAVWKGVRLRDILKEAKPAGGVVQVLSQSADGYAHTATFDQAMDPTTLIAYEMNGEPLPQRHGYPARLLIANYFGEASVKWITRIELLDHKTKRYYEEQGYEPMTVPITSRFYSPDFDHTNIKTGTTVPLKGIAYSGNEGISKVEVSTDGGSNWKEARITYTPSSKKIAWYHWSYDWRPGQSGKHMLSVRATDLKGNLQVAKESGPAPDGATGYQQVSVKVKG